MTLRPTTSAGALVPLYRPQPLPKPPAELWRLLKAAADTSDLAMGRAIDATEQVETLGQRAIGMVHKLADERRDLQQTMDRCANEMMILAQKLHVEGIEGVQGQLSEQAQRLDQVAANQKMILTNQHRLQTDMKNLEAAVRQLIRHKTPAAEQ